MAVAPRASTWDPSRSNWSMGRLAIIWQLANAHFDGQKDDFVGEQRCKAELDSQDILLGLEGVHHCSGLLGPVGHQIQDDWQGR